MSCTISIAAHFPTQHSGAWGLPTPPANAAFKASLLPFSPSPKHQASCPPAACATPVCPGNPPHQALLVLSPVPQTSSQFLPIQVLKVLFKLHLSPELSHLPSVPSTLVAIVSPSLLVPPTNATVALCQPVFYLHICQPLPLHVRPRKAENSSCACCVCGGWSLFMRVDHKELRWVL